MLKLKKRIAIKAICMNYDVKGLPQNYRLLAQLLSA